MLVTAAAAVNVPNEVLVSRTKVSVCSGATQNGVE